MPASREHFTRSGKRVLCSTAYFNVRNDFPYGVWFCQGGRTVLFNRFYEPIWQRTGDGPVAEADAREWVEGIERQAWFYDDGFTERARRRVAKEALGAFQRGEPLCTLVGPGLYHRAAPMTP